MSLAVVARAHRASLAKPALLLQAARFHAGRPSAVKTSEPAKASADAYAYVPGGPILKGSVNEPTTYPTPNKSHGSYHWSFERLLSASLVPLTTSSFLLSTTAYPALDGMLGLALVVHSHIGFDACFEDYLHPRKFPVLGNIAKWGLRAATTGALVGIYAFNTNDIGLTELVKRAWVA